MSTTLSFGPVSIAWPWNYQLVAVPNNTTSPGPFSYAGSQLTNGTGAGQADILYTNQLSLAASGTTTLNLSSLTTQLGTSVSMARIKSFYWENSNSATSTGVAFGGAGSTPFTGGYFNAGTDTLTLLNGVAQVVGVCADATAYAVSTGVNLLITNSDSVNAAKVNVGLVGCSA
jgi:hypothetical protein